MDHHLTKLSPPDLDLISDLVLVSGSLKDLAQVYDVSYPTIRVRLDRVIERLRALRENRPPDPMSDYLAQLVERGELSVTAARTIRDLSRSLENAYKETPHVSHSVNGT